jgi:hypothetical protein
MASTQTETRLDSNFRMHFSIHMLSEERTPRKEEQP